MMQKRAINRPAEEPISEWLDLESNASVEVTSEDPAQPIESALIPGRGSGWRAGQPGLQIIRLIFNRPQRISRVRLKFSEREAERTQEFALSWGQKSDRALQEVCRQQWNFSPHGSTEELEEYSVNLDAASMLELKLNPDVSGREAFASLDEFRVA